MQIFNSAFLETPVQEIERRIHEDGIFAFEGAIESEAVDTIMEQIGGLDFQINVNSLLPVISKYQTYQNHFMALSKVAFDLVCHERISSICDAVLGDVYHIVGKRIYETRFGQYMPFHSDGGKVLREDQRHQTDVLGFIFYMCDVDDGAFEIVEGSHRWRETYTGTPENDAVLIEQNPVRKFPMPKGSYVIYDGRLLHRARPMTLPGQARQSFHFQVNRGYQVGEPIYLNAGWIGDLSERAKMLLGIGVPSTQKTWPQTSPAHIPKDDERLIDYLRKNFARYIRS